MPCGTASLARERPVAASLRALGVPNPPPLRSAQFPLGLPNLSSFHQAKVDAANQLYRLGVEILVYCHRRGIVVSIENPATSWIWAALVRISMELSDEAARVLNALERVEFHACCHGSTRRKHTAWLGTNKVFSKLAAVCNYDHPHDAWGVRWTANGWVFDTSTEAAYPALLAQRVVSCLIQEAKNRQISLEKPLRLHDAATAVQGKQSKRHKPLIPEFHHFVKQQAGTVLQTGSKLLAPHLGGDLREESGQNSADDQKDDENMNNDKFDKVGFYHNPKQFVSLAMGVQHPMDATEHLEAVTRYALEFNLKYPPHVVMLERKKNLLQARLLAKQFEQQEKQLHESLPPSLQKVLHGKQLLVWKKLLERYEYDDMQVYDFMASGVKLTGMHDTPACYPEKIRPATLTQEDLEASAIWRRRAVIGKKFQQKDPLHAAHLEETATEELDMGFLEGPFRSEAEVSAYFGHSRWMVVRRFVLVQGSEMKLRPIDDCLESQLNQAYTSTSYLKLQDLDYVTSLALRIAEAVSEKRQKHGSGRWLGKCLDLSKAYKQMGIAPEQRHLAVIFFTKADGQPVFYVANALMFGATAAVYAFNRVSRSLWFLLNRMLAIPCGVFYDDFPLFAPEELALDTDACASELLDLLGWRHARTGPKGRPFECKFQVLGCALDLTNVAQGVLVAENKPGRIDRLLAQLESIKVANSNSLHEAQVIHGLMRYACGFFSGRHLHQVCAEVLAMCSTSAKRSSRGIGDFCKPRTIEAHSEKRPFLIFTDGSWEQGHAGIGAVAIDTASGEKFVWAGQVPQSLLDRWRLLVGEQLICDGCDGCD